VLLGGCSKLVPKLDEVIPDTRKEYQKSRSLPDLEVPPELSTEAIRDRMVIPEGGDAARYSTYQERRAERQRQQEVEKSQTSAIRVLENEHVLAIEGAPVQVWPKLLEFWQREGYALELDDVELGVIETAWNEDKAQLSRDKFKVFAEAGGEAGTTVLYVSHEGQELQPEGEELVWQRKPRDVERERTVVERLQRFMGGDLATAVAAAEPAAAADAEAGAEVEPEAPTSPALAPAVPAEPVVGGEAPVTGKPHHAELVSVGGGKVYLTVAEDFPTAWKTTARALEEAGVTVKDSDKGRGVYLIEMTPKAAGEEEDPGMLSKLKFWDRGKSAELQVSLTGVGEKTEVVVLDRDGRWETGEEAGRLLNRLHDVLNSGRI
jgi:outer membrane protein assembly factor BamC